MYNPQRFKCEDLDEAYRFMDRYPFATLITVMGNEPSISHIPLTPRKMGDQIELIGHMARANPHWRILSQAVSKVVFHGPHAYITPMWYAENDVPTWNYSVVHAQGSVQLLESHDEIVDCLKQLSAHAEKHWPSGWKFFIPDDLAGDVLRRSIVGFKISVEQINFKMKLGQNRSVADQEGVLRGLKTRTDDNSQAIRAQLQGLQK